LPDYYNTFFRNYDQALGRFVAVDPLAEAAESLTGYNYSANNPVMFNDPMGDQERKQPFEIPLELPVGGSESAGGLPPWLGSGKNPARDLINRIFQGQGINQELLNAAKTGDPAAVQAYVREYGTSIYSSANGPLGNIDDLASKINSALYGENLKDKRPYTAVGLPGRLNKEYVDGVIGEEGTGQRSH
jgi:hypothetical protein